MAYKDVLLKVVLLRVVYFLIPYRIMHCNGFFQFKLMFDSVKEVIVSLCVEIVSVFVMRVQSNGFSEKYLQPHNTMY